MKTLPFRFHAHDEAPRRPRDPYRILAPLVALAFPLVVGFALVVLTERHDVASVAFELDIAREETLEPLEEPPQEETEPTETADATAVEVTIANDMPDASAAADIPSLSPPVLPPVLTPPPPPEAVMQVKSPVSLKSLAGATRSLAGRAAARKRFGGSEAAEAAVLRALRWIKAAQRPDGSWKARGEGDPTAFALLAFLSHGEGLSSPEFGPTVRSAVEYLIDNHGNNMAVYALAEAAAVIRTPVLDDVATQAVREFCLRQPKKLRPNVGGIIQRYAGAMVIVAARMARLKVSELAAVEQTYAAAFAEMRDAKSANGFDKVRGLGAWHYMVAGVCLQYLGRGEEPPTRAMLAHLDGLWPPATLGTTSIACCPVRSNYFSTMIFFNAGGALWEKWNRGMLEAYESSQVVEGKTGYWRCQDQHIGDQPFWTTCYVAHQLMIYYRYLPTYSKEAWSAQANRTKKAPSSKEDAVIVEVDL